MQHACLACGGRITHPLYNPAPQPLAALNLPRSAEAARNALRFPMNFRVCALCGHIFNVEFDYYKIPYEDDSNLMFNRGALWMEHLDALARLLVERHGAAGKTLVDIGCGDGLFLKLLRQRSPTSRCVGFEPGVESENARRNGLEVYKDYFHPARDLMRLRPDFLVCRHVLEHLHNPREFVAGIAYWSNLCDVQPAFLAEVPRIDNAVAQGRLTDFLYEHVSHFTEQSFRAMFAGTGFDVLDLRACYGDEVVVALVRPQRTRRPASIRRSTEAFRASIEDQLQHVGEQLERFEREGKSVAFWGGTGKGAAFLNAFGVDAERFPIVVDSDRNKLGRFVPGTAQEIRSPDHLKAHPVDVIVITTRWRAQDIYEEIQREGIPHEAVWVLQRGRLRPYAGEDAWASEASVRIEGGHPALSGPRATGRPQRPTGRPTC